MGGWGVDMDKDHVWMAGWKKGRETMATQQDSQQQQQSNSKTLDPHTCMHACCLLARLSIQVRSILI